jgi:hypothetical protein
VTCACPGIALNDVHVDVLLAQQSSGCVASVVESRVLVMPAATGIAFHSSQSSCGWMGVGPHQMRSQSCHACRPTSRSAS